MNYLVEPSSKYVDRILNSWHYLNCPKHMLNHDLDCVYRQGIVHDKETAIKFVTDYLRYYDIKNPILNATMFVNWRDSITLKEFSVINVNNYIDNLPSHVQNIHKRVCEYMDKHTTYYPAYLGGGVKSVPQYPFKHR